MSTRPRRAALHQRSDSETNEIRIVPSLHSNNSSVSQKANDVSSWVPHPTTASISRDSTRSSSRTASTSRCRGSHRTSGSLDSLPPVAPLHINKIEPTFIIARDPITAPARESSYSDTLVGGSNPSLNAAPITIKAQTFPKSILKKTLRAVLPPNSTEEYKQRSSSWVGSSSQSPITAGRARMNARTLRIVRGEGDEQDEEGEEINTVGELVRRSATGTPSPRTWPLSEPSAQAGYPFPNWSLPARSPSSASLQRPGTAGSLFASAKQLPSWARYVFLCDAADWFTDSTDVPLEDISMARREVGGASLSLTCPEVALHMQQSAGPIPGFVGSPAMILYLLPKSSSPMQPTTPQDASIHQRVSLG